MCLFSGPFYFLSFVIFGSNRYFFSFHLFLCGHVFVLALMGCWCYHMIFHLASSVWLAWLQSLRNSCSLLTTRFFILLFSLQFSILPFSFGILVFVLFCVFIYLFLKWKDEYAVGKWEKWGRFRLGLGVQDWSTTCAAPVHSLENVMRVEGDFCFMERWRPHSDWKWSFAGLQADAWVKVSPHCPGISNSVVEQPSFKASRSQDVSKLHMGITLQ